VTACGVLIGSVSVGAQSGAPNPREALASPYINLETGITLEEAIARALAQEPTLRATRTAVDVANGERLQADVHPNPTVLFMQQLEPGGTDSQSRVEVQWPLDLFRKTGRVAVAEQEVQATQRSVSDRERLLAAEVRMKYGDVVAAVRDLSVSDDLVATTARQVELLRARVEQGGAPRLERNMVEVELRRLEAERMLEAGRVDRVVIELKRLLGMRPDAPLQLHDSLEELVMRELNVPMKPDATAPAIRADVQEAEARLRAADAQIDRAEREGRFDLSLFGSYMRTDAGFPQLGVNGQGELTRIRDVFHYVSAGVAVTVPLRNQNKGQVAMAQAERTAATARLTAAQLTAESEIGAATARDERARGAIAVYRGGARDLARQNLDVVSQTYELGRATVFDVLAEQRRYLDFERGYSHALREAYDARTGGPRGIPSVGEPRDLQHARPGLAQPLLLQDRIDLRAGQVQVAQERYAK
jgi:cobalt-zinc-cadmium efflux system outer membrane protein